MDLAALLLHTTLLMLKLGKIELFISLIDGESHIIDCSGKCWHRIFFLLLR